MRGWLKMLDCWERQALGYTHVIMELGKLWNWESCDNPGADPSYLPWLK